MIRSHVGSSTLFLLLFACTGSGTSGDVERPGQRVALVAAVVDSMTKVRPGAPVDGAHGAVLVAARNEFESFQVVVQAEDAPLENLTVTLSGPLAGPDGAEIPASHVTIYRVGTVDVETASDLEGAPGPWPDPLIPTVDPLLGEDRSAFPVDVPAGEQRVAWIDIWRDEVERLGLEDRAFVWSCDEPHFFPVYGDPAGNWPLCIAVLEEDRAAWPEARRLVTAHVQTVERHGRADLIDIMVVNVEFLDGPEGSPYFAGNQRPLYDDFLGLTDRPRELWLYSACGSHGCTRNDDPYTTGWAGGYEIDAPASQTRAMPWLAFRYDLDGLLYYDTVLQLATAWDDQYRYTGNGEGTFFYPGTPDRIGGRSAVPIESVRLKYLRDGLEDYEYLVHLSENGRRGDAERIAQALFPATWDTSRTPAEIAAARAELVELAEGLGAARGR